MGQKKKLDESLVVEVTASLVDSAEAAEIIGVTQTSIKRYVKNGDLFGVKIGNGLFVLRSDAEAFEPRPPGRPRGES